MRDVAEFLCFIISPAYFDPALERSSVIMRTKTVNKPNQGGFAAAGNTGHEHHFSRRDIKRNILKRAARAERILIGNMV